MDLAVRSAIVYLIFRELFLIAADTASGDNTPVAYNSLLPVYFADDQNDVTVVIASPTELKCSLVFANDADLNVTWYKDGDVIKNSTGRWISVDGALHVAGLEPQADEGVYEYHAQHEIGIIASRRFHLFAPKLPEFRKHPQDVTVFQGESVRLECLTSGTPEPVIAWVKDGQPLDINGTRSNAFSGILQILEVTQLDEGSYECFATNTAGEQKSRAATLIVRSYDTDDRISPRLLSGHRNRTAIVFESVLLECLLTGKPRPNVSWRKQDGAMFSSTGHVRVTQFGNLEISSVQLSDSGTYICSWMSDRDEGTKSFLQTRLLVLSPPKLIPNGAMELHTLKRRRQVVRLKCEFDGVPLPDVVWMKNGRLLEPSGRIKVDKQELVIASSDTSDSGFYQCRGENAVGAIQFMTWVNVEANENAPLPPVNLTAVPLSSSTVRLSWEDHLLNYNRTIIAYSVHVFPTKGGVEIQEVVKKLEGLTMSECNISVFQPFTNYTFYIVAYSVDGGSDHSAYVTAMTKEDVPLDAPLMELVLFEPNAIRVRWSELGLELAHGIVLEYAVLLRLHGNSSYWRKSLDVGVQEFIIQGLQLDTEYDVVVLAATKIGYPSLDSVSWVTIATESSGNAGAPDCPEMNLTQINSYGILVTWRSGNLLEVEGFKLTCWRINQRFQKLVDDDLFQIINLDKGADRYIFTELESYAVYQVSLAAKNQFGWSGSITKTCRTDSLVNGDSKNSAVDFDSVSLPLPPTIIYAESVNSSAMIVRWEKPPIVDPITRYTVRYRPDSSETVSFRTDISIVKFVTSPTEMAVIGGLAAHTLYDLSIQTHTNDAIGPFSSSIVKCRTQEGVPSEPIGVQLVLYSLTAVLISWNPPAHRNGIIVHYLILYTDDSSRALSQWHTKISSGSSLSSLVSPLSPDTIYFFRLQAATFAGAGQLTDVVNIQTQSLNDLLSSDTADVPTSNMLSDQDLGIIIGTTIGLTCIVLCIVIIIIRDRCSVASSAPPTRNHVANGVVKTCHCHLANCSDIEQPHEPWSSNGGGGSDDDDFPPVNSTLVENENCDTKGGYSQSGRHGKIPVRLLMSYNPCAAPQCNGIHLYDIQVPQDTVPRSDVKETVNAQSEVPYEALSDQRCSRRHLPSKQLLSDASSAQSFSVDDIMDQEPINAINRAQDGSPDEGSEGYYDDNNCEGHFNQSDKACESEQTVSLLGNSCLANHNHELPALSRSASCIVGKSTGFAEKEKKELAEEELNKEEGLCEATV